MLTVIRDHIGTDEQETSTLVARMLGVSNSKPFRDVVHSSIEELVSRQFIENRSGKLFIGSESATEMAYRS